jgi:UPF0716 family protein affecting phage T7 exclusion
MINLFIGLFLLCSTLGAAISKSQGVSVIKKPRQHTEPLKLD